MKSLITKRQLLFVILVLLCGINPIYADTSKKLYVNCGNLSDLLPERERFKITDLTLSGQLDIRDLEVIRQMGGCRESYESRYNGHLRYLDLSNAEFVSGGTFGTYADDYFRTSDLNDGSGDYLFSDMKSLHTIKLPNSMEIMGQYLFVGCESLTSVTLPKSLKTLPDRTFYNCTNLTSIELPSGVTEIGDYAFYNCTNLSSLTLPSGVKEIGFSAFQRCI